MLFECCRTNAGQRITFEGVDDEKTGSPPYGPSADDTVKATYLVIWKSGLKVRSGLELSSQEMRTVSIGSTVDVYEWKENQQGVLRMRMDGGWVNETYAGSGDPLVERIDTDERCPLCKLLRVDPAGNGGTVWDSPGREHFVGAIDVGVEVRFLETFENRLAVAAEEAKVPEELPQHLMPSPGHGKLPGNEVGPVLDSNGEILARITSPLRGWVVIRPADLSDDSPAGPLFAKVGESPPADLLADDIGIEQGEQTEQNLLDGAEADPEPDPSVEPAQKTRTSGMGTWTEILCDGLSGGRHWIDCLHDDEDVATHFFLTITRILMTARTNEQGRGLYEVALTLEGSPDTEYGGVAEYSVESTLSKGHLYHAHFEFAFDAPLQSPGKVPFSLWGCLRGVPGHEGEAQSFPMSPEQSVIMLCLRDSKGRNRRFQQKGGARPSPSVFAAADHRDGEALAMFRVVCEAGLAVRKSMDLSSEVVKTLPVGELLEVLEFAVNEDGWLGQFRVADGWASEFDAKTNEPLIARAAADDEDVRKMRNGQSVLLVPDDATGNRRKSRNGVEFLFETQPGSGHQKAVIMQQRPLGFEIDPKPPHRVLSVKAGSHAHDLGVMQGWLLLRAGDLELREGIRMCAAEKVMEKFDEVVSVLPDMTPESSIKKDKKKKKGGCSIS